MVLKSFLGVKPALILGPVCSVAADGVNDFSKHWNIPMMTSGAMARAFTMEHQPTLTRVTAPYTEIGEVFKTLFLKEEYNKFPIHLLYHSPEDLTKECLEKYRSRKYTVLAENIPNERKDPMLSSS